ncbi:MAG: helix-turn-helix domain-containing protein, partial [Pirellulales bacterium]
KAAQVPAPPAAAFSCATPMNDVDLSDQLHELQRQFAELRELLVGGTAKQSKNGQADSTWLTPPQLAKQLGVQAEKVLGWIRSGELRAVNVADRAGRRPRWRISAETIEEFLRRREAVPRSAQPKSTGYHYAQPCTDGRGKAKRESDGRFAKNSSYQADGNARRRKQVTHRGGMAALR